ncbi:MAG: M56 family metallopeptidase [Paramuribaculum sp.]|nr:M56 family metallopeptidase [Paramuribaculum sp.]
MGAITAYAMSVAIILAVEYIVYKCLLANTTFYRLNRRVLIMCYIVALLAIPMAHILRGLVPAADNGKITAEAAMWMGAVADGTNHDPLLNAVPAVYLAGVVLMAIFTAVSYVRMWLIIRSGSHKFMEGATMVVLDRPVSPFSWDRYIVVSSADAADRLIVDHELCHIRHGHSFDLFFARLFVIFNWFNPVAYLMCRELSAVHEYEVDQDILASGVTAFDYQMLLIKKTVGSRFQSIANSLNHSQLKNRLTMMQKSRSKRGRSLCAVALLPAALLAVSMTDIPAVASTIRNVAAVSYGKVSENPQPEQVPAERKADEPQAQASVAPEKLPQYPGGERELFNAVMSAIRYPEAPYKEGASGLTVISFTVKKDGTIDDIKLMHSSGYGDLDAEAIRAVRESATARWTPGYYNGEPVDCKYVLPIRFALKK